MTAPLLPLFVKLAGRDVVLVGGGAMAAVRARQLAEAGARLTVVAPEVRDEVAALAARVVRRAFEPGDLDGAWLAVAAATAEVNRAVAAAAEERRLLVNAVDDPGAASAYTAGVVRRGDATVAISTGGRAPALAGLLREAIDALLPPELDAWVDVAEAERPAWKRARVPLATRRPLLLEKLNERYATSTSTPTSTPTSTTSSTEGGGRAGRPSLSPRAAGGEGQGEGGASATPRDAIEEGRSTSTSAPSPLRPAGGEAPARERAPREGEGFVSLVGAGPGDPGLLTRRAAERLAAADVVLYDALVDPSTLRLAPRAHCFLVGKRAGRPSVSQRAIERLLVRAARRGQRVVRLKCGDPFVFGRGGEEAQALLAAGVPFEIVPGVSSALAAPALAGVPVTHRGLSAGFVVLSGHAERAYGPILDGVGPNTVTVVVLMGLATRAAIAARLLALGWSASTPAAVVLGASHDAAFAWRGTLAGLGDAALPADRAHLPGVLVVGAVAALALASGAPEGAPLPRAAANGP